MNQFLDLLDTNYTLPIKIVFDSVVFNGVPHIMLCVNNKILFNNDVMNETVISHNIALLDPLNISIIMSNKQYHISKETAVVIKTIEIDGFNLIPEYNHYFNYDNDHNINSSSNYLGYNGIWYLQTTVPFYNWKHIILGNGWLIQP